eukprot:gene7534-8970_t
MSDNLSRPAASQAFSQPSFAEDPTSEGIPPCAEYTPPRVDHTEDPCADCTPPRGDYARDGFVTLENLITPATVDILNERLERVLRGQYDTGTAPDKRPKLLKDNNKGVLGFSGNTQGVRTLQLINIWKADTQFKQLVLSSKLGHIVAELAGWKSGSPPLVFHRDTPYFDFNPSDVVTVWLALDHMDPCLGPLQYVKGSHRWGEGRTGSANMFFDKDTKALLYSAAEREGVSREDVDDHLLWLSVLYPESIEIVLLKLYNNGNHAYAACR